MISDKTIALLLKWAKDVSDAVEGSVGKTITIETFAQHVGHQSDWQRRFPVFVLFHERADTGWLITLIR